MFLKYKNERDAQVARENLNNSEIKLEAVLMSRQNCIDEKSYLNLGKERSSSLGSKNDTKNLGFENNTSNDDFRNSNSNRDPNVISFSILNQGALIVCYCISSI